MDIAEIKTEQRQVESAIRQLLSDFEKKTGVFVGRIELYTTDIRTLSEVTQSRFIEGVKLNIGI